MVVLVIYLIILPEESSPEPVSEGNEPVEDHTDREGIIIYNIPRQVKIDNKYIGNRIRGKWMKVDITKKNPTDLFTISHVITKFRQSYS